MALLLFTCAAGAHTYAPSSVLSSGTFVKIQVSESGLYSLTYDELRSMGLTPANLRIYGYGGAMLTQNFSQNKIDDLPEVPYVAADNRVIFYGQGSVSWRYNGTYFVHTRNPYSDYGYYFLTSDKGTPGTFPAANTASGTGMTVNTYTERLLHEKDSLNLVDRTGVEGGGREFYGEFFTNGACRRFTFPEMAGTTGADRHIYAEVAAASGATSDFTMTCGSTNVTKQTAAIASSDFYTKATSTQIEAGGTSQGEKDITLCFSSGSSNALGFLNYIEVNIDKPLSMTGSTPLFFRSKTGYGSSQPVTFTISGTSAETEVWDISDLSDIRRVTYTRNGSELSFSASNRTVHEYVAFNPGTVATLTPAEKGQIATQNLHALSNIDYVIITPASLKQEAQRLADAHAEADGMTTAVVTDEEVYNEFSSGTPDASAYRWLMKMLYDKARASGGTIAKPQYLLLFGDGSFDNRKLLATSGNNTLLTYQAKNSLNEVKAYASDDYFGFLDDTEGEVDVYGRLDIGVGRMPVNNVTEAKGVVDKMIRHITQPNKGRWKNQMVFLADDGDHNLHTRGADKAGEALRRHTPDFITHKIYLDAYTQEVNASGEQYPLAQQKLNNLLKDGVLLFDYCGHSGYNNATSEGLISSANIRKMQNDNLAFWMFASCSFSLFDGGKTSAGEEAVLNPNGGALAICAANRTVYANQNEELNMHICDSLFAHPDEFTYPRRLGDAVRFGKNACGSDENKMSYLLLGDPAASLHFPTQYQVRTTSISDTINALSVNSISGYVEASSGEKAEWFNGRLFITVLDKMQQISTLDNDESNPDLKQRYTYNDYPNTLFQGETEVKDGEFTFTFMTPKDIRYNYGNGRIVYYAYDTESGEEGVGHYENFVIGGSAPVQVVDSTGPQLNIYLDTPAFTNGGKTNETPHFFAEIFDENGINTVGSGIGHDLLLIVDGKPAETYVLNEYFSAESNSYRQGTVSYRMQELSEGMHSLFFRAWDLVNNSTSATLNFEVVNGLQPSIMSVIGYPNPVKSDGILNIAVDYNQPDVIMQTEVFIYDLSGRLVHRMEQRGTEGLQWNVDGSATPAGVYMYKVVLSSETTKTTSKTGKLIIIK